MACGAAAYLSSNTKKQVLRCQEGLHINIIWCLNMPGKIIFIFSVLLFRGILDFSYVNFVSVVYEYSGFNLQVDVLGYLASWVFMLGATAFTSDRLSKVSDYFFVVALLGVFAPLTSLYGLSSREVFPVVITFLAIAIIYFISRSRYIKAPSVPLLRGGPLIAVVLSASMVAMLVVWYFASGAVRYFNLNFLKVYEFRGLSAEIANVGVLSYLNSWVYQVFSVFLFSYSLLKRNFVTALIVFFIQIFFYGVTAHKSVLFFPVMVVGIWFYFRATNKLLIVPVAFSGIVFFCFLVWYFLDDVLFASMFIRRVFYVPAILTYDYFNFFEENRHIYWSNSILSTIFEYPYALGLTALIGQYNGTNAGANNGFVSSGYAHAGVWGVCVYSVIFGLLIRFIDIFSKNIPVWFALALVVVPYRSALISSDLFTVMLTHGFLIAMLMLLLVRPKSFNTIRKGA